MKQIIEWEKCRKREVLQKRCDRIGLPAIGAFDASLRYMHIDLTGNVALKEAIKRAGMDPQTIDDARFGC